MKDKSNKCRINAYISKKNYISIDELMRDEHLISMTLSKGAILDLALSCFFRSLDVGESLESLAIQHLERIEDENLDETFKRQALQKEGEILRPEGDNV